jgi:hypothetical protein
MPRKMRQYAQTLATIDARRVTDPGKMSHCTMGTRAPRYEKWGKKAGLLPRTSPSIAPESVLSGLEDHPRKIVRH